ncbi:M3 family metallopeptidase, partial [Vogesella mureinivorans]|uniref:M3 family metallopeptidase n=1 Tax=Vogesella mureinivorans TaxID=657276 RepID=UPI00197D9209
FKPAKVDVWQDEVEYYDVVDKQTSQLLGGLYIDKFPREGAVNAVLFSSILFNPWGMIYIYILFC